MRQLQTALQRAQATNQELALVADRVTDAILICDAQRCISWVNPAFTRLTGFSLTECHGQLPEELLSGPHTDAAIVAQINQSLAQGASVERLEVCHHRKDGEPFWKLPKRPPAEIKLFSPDDKLHLCFVTSLAVLRAKLFDIGFS